MGNRDAPDPLKDLGKRIEKADVRRPASPSGSDRRASGMAMGLRIGLELVVGVGVGVFVGWLVDRWLGIRPWGTVGGFFLGVAAGMVNVYRAVAGLGMAVGYKPGDRAVPPPADDEWDED
jgi:ATP synthase protein I